MITSDRSLASLAVPQCAVLLAIASLFCAAPARSQTIFVGEYYNERASRYLADGTNQGTFAALSASGARFYGMATDSAGRLYVGANGGGGGFRGIRRFSPAGALLGSISMNNNGAVAVGANDVLFAGDYGTGNIMRYDASGASLGLFATAASGLAGMGFDAAGNLFTVDEGATVHKYSASGQDLGVFATGQSGARCVAVTAAGDVLVVNRGTQSVRRYSAAGQDLGVYASSANGLTDPTGIAIDLAGGIYIANHSGGGTTTVRKFSAAGQDLGTFAAGAAVSSVAAYRAVGVTVPEASPLLLATLGGLAAVGAGIVRRRQAPR